MKNKNLISESIAKAGKSLWNMFPLILGTVLVVSLINAGIPKSFYLKIFTNNIIKDSFIGSAIGSISAGFPGVSYIIGGELLNQGVSLIAVTAFLVAWVTVGFVQLPAESMILGKKFALIRNISAFVLAILVAIIVVGLMGVLG